MNKHEKIQLRLVYGKCNKNALEEIIMYAE